MKTLVGLFANLRPSFMLGFVVVWNLVFVVVGQLNGGSGAFNTIPAAVVAAVACAGVGLVGFGSLSSPGVRSVVLRPTADLTAARPGLVFLGVLGSVLAVWILVDAFVRIQQ
jgi:hypothetical protein